MSETTQAKREASKANGKLGGRPPKVVFAWQCSVCGSLTVERQRKRPDACADCSGQAWTSMFKVYR